MKELFNRPSQEKHLFRSSYCLTCNQKKTCGEFSPDYCCPCSYQNQRKSWSDYSTSAKALSYEKRQRKEHQENLEKLAKRKTFADRTDFADWKKFYRQKSWGLDLEEWLREKRILPIDSNCAKKWHESKQHLPANCGCLERKAKENFLYFADCLQRNQKRLAKCRCETSEKVRVDYLDSEGSGWTDCEKCQRRIASAGHHGVIKNRNDPKFWGLKVKEKALCGKCLGKLVEKMPAGKKYTFRKYEKRGCW